MLTIDRKPDGTVTVAGVIDETADLAPLQDATGPLVLDLGGVSRINSVGVREWIRAMQRIPDDVPVTWERVSTALVTQLNMIANFNGHARIASFFAPYYCEACDEESRALLTVDALSGKPEAPARTCADCEGPLVFDDIEEDYLSSVLQLG